MLEAWRCSDRTTPWIERRRYFNQLDGQARRREVGRYDTIDWNGDAFAGAVEEFEIGRVHQDRVNPLPVVSGLGVPDIAIRQDVTVRYRKSNQWRAGAGWWKRTQASVDTSLVQLADHLFHLRGWLSRYNEVGKVVGIVTRRGGSR